MPSAVARSIGRTSYTLQSWRRCTLERYRVRNSNVTDVVGDLGSMLHIVAIGRASRQREQQEPSRTYSHWELAIPLATLNLSGRELGHCPRTARSTNAPSGKRLLPAGSVHLSSPPGDDAVRAG
jgi:hypothetical protein